MDLDEALWRAAAFADQGADALFIDALRSKEEMRAFCKVAPGVPKMANMLEGGGSTPICTPEELQDMGFSIVAYPLSLLAVSVKAMERALREIKDEGYPSDDSSRRSSTCNRPWDSQNITTTTRDTKPDTDDC